MRAVVVALWIGLLAGAASAQPKPVEPDTDALIQANTYAFRFDGGELSGPGAEFLRKATASSQFVLLGENHFDHNTPLFAGALFHMLEREDGFDHLVVEQDGVGIDDLLAPGVRGDPAAAASVAKRHPTLIGFASDQDLELLADVGAREHGLSPIWGLEQTQGAARYLEELEATAPTPALKAMVAPLLAEAKIDDTRETMAKFLAEDTMTYGRLQVLQSAWKAAPGSRADRLLTGLVKSAEIYSYYFRAEAGEPVGLLNNTVRETWLKDGFVRHYRAESSEGRPIKAMFKFGDTHMIRGLDPASAFPIGAFAHEFAIANGMNAYGIEIAPTGDFAKITDHPAYMRVLFPKEPLTSPVLVDLRPLRNYQRYFRAKVALEDQWLFREFINGYDAIVILPNSRKATFERTGFPWLAGR